MTELLKMRKHFFKIKKNKFIKVKIQNKKINNFDFPKNIKGDKIYGGEKIKRKNREKIKRKK